MCTFHDVHISHCPGPVALRRSCQPIRSRHEGLQACRVGGYPSLTVSDSLFLANDVGAQADVAQVRMSHSLLVKNRVGVLVTGWDTPWPGDTYPCAGLTTVRFVRNGTNLDGPPR